MCNQPSVASMWVFWWYKAGQLCFKAPVSSCVLLDFSLLIELKCCDQKWSQGGWRIPGQSCRFRGLGMRPLPLHEILVLQVVSTTITVLFCWTVSSSSKGRWFVRYMGMMMMIHVPVGSAPLASTTFYKNAALFHNFLALTRHLCWSGHTLQRRKRWKMSCRWASGLTGVAVGQHEGLENIWKRDDPLHHLLLVHHHQPVHLKEKQETFTWSCPIKHL